MRIKVRAITLVAVPQRFLAMPGTNACGLNHEDIGSRRSHDKKSACPLAFQMRRRMRTLLSFAGQPVVGGGWGVVDVPFSTALIVQLPSPI